MAALVLLPDELLLHIFNIVNLKDQLHLRTVCQRFQYLIDILWHDLEIVNNGKFHSVLNFESETANYNALCELFASKRPNLHHLGFPSPSCLSKTLIRKLQTACDHLQSVQFTENVHIDSIDLKVLLKNSATITSVSLVLPPDSHQLLKTLKPFASQLKGLELEFENEKMNAKEEIYFRSLFLHCKNLCELSLIRVHINDLSCIFRHCRRLKNAEFHHCSTSFEFSFLDEINCRRLKRIQFDHCTNLTSSALELLGRKCPLIESLEFFECFESNEDDDLGRILSKYYCNLRSFNVINNTESSLNFIGLKKKNRKNCFIHLHSLSIHSNVISSKDLIRFSELSMNLNVLTLFIENMNNQAVVAIGELLQLSTLVISFHSLSKTDLNPILNLNSLQHLGIINSNAVQTSFLVSAVLQLSNIRSFYFADCHQLKTKSLTETVASLDVTKPLFFRVCRSGVDLNKLMKRLRSINITSKLEEYSSEEVRVGSIRITNCTHGNVLCTQCQLIQSTDYVTLLNDLPSVFNY